MQVLQMPWNQPTPSEDVLVLVLVLSIDEQPAQFYRFRYESEVDKDSSRVGGLLLGRSSTKDNRSCMRVRVSGIDPAVHSQLKLTVCTVSAEDKAPHPYYLHGDNCNYGYFELKKSVDSTFRGSEWEITFDRLAVICVPKKMKTDIEKGMEERRRNVPLIHGCPDAPSIEYKSSNLGRIRLAFSLSFTDTGGHDWALSPVFSDEIVSDKEKKIIEVSCLNPSEVPMQGGCKVAILTSNPTSGIQKSGVKVYFTVTNEVTGKQSMFVVDVFEMKKHLLLVESPDVTRMTDNDRLKCVVTVHSQGFQSEELNIIFLRRIKISGLKRPRQN